MAAEQHRRMGQRIVGIGASLPQFQRLRDDRVCIGGPPKLQQKGREHAMHGKANLLTGHGLFGKRQRGEQVS